MSVALRNPSRVTTADYLRLEDAAVERHELIDGVLYAKAGGSDRHNLIAGNFFAQLHAHLPDRCQAFEHSMKLKVEVESAENFYYPDILVSCSPADRAALYREQPLLLAVVLSPSTERADRTDKFAVYRGIPSLQEYVLVAQDVPQVEVFRRRNAWRLETYFLEHTFTLESVALDVPVARLYRRVTF